MKALVIAPTNSDLTHVPKEVETAANYIDAKILQGEVTLADLMLALRKKYDLVWFATHGTSEGIELSDGMVKVSRLIQLLRTKAGAIFLNTCESEDVAVMLYAELRKPIICTIGPEIEDVSAFVTGATFAGHIKDGYSIAEAYELSKPGFNENYRMFSGGGDGDRIDELYALIAELGAELTVEIRAVAERVERLETDMALEFANIRGGFHVKLGRSHLAWWASGAILFALMMFVLLSDFRNHYNLGRWEAWGMGLTLLFSAIFMLSRGLGFTFE